MTGTWIEEAFAEVDQMKLDSLKNNQDISKIITSEEKAESVININGVEIKIKSFISRPLRRKLAKAQLASESSDIGEMEGAMYECLAAVCTSEPFNDPTTWRYIDEQGGDINKYLTIIMSEVAEVSKKTREFRPKS